MYFRPGVHCSAVLHGFDVLWALFLVLLVSLAGLVAGVAALLLLQRRLQR